MNKETNGNTLKYRVDKVESCFDELDTKVEDILTNHLPHIKEEILKSRAEITKDISDLRLVVKENTVKVAIIVSILMTLFSMFLNKLI